MVMKSDKVRYDSPRVGMLTSNAVLFENRQGSRPAFSSDSTRRAVTLASSNFRCFSCNSRAARCAGSNLASSSSSCFRFSSSSCCSSSVLAAPSVSSSSLRCHCRGCA